MDSDAIIPQRRSALAPLEPHLNIDIFLIDIIQVVEDDVAFGPVQTHDTIRHGSVDPECFPACGGMDADEGVGAFDVLRAGVGVVAV